MNQAVFGVNTVFKVFSLSSLIFKERSTFIVRLTVGIPTAPR